MKCSVNVRAATVADVDAIWELLEIYVPGGTVLRRSKEDISFYIGNFWVAESQSGVCGCAALRDFGNDLLEVRSVVIHPDMQGRGIGKVLLENIIAELRQSRAHWRLFTLTTTPAFFKSLGFAETAKEEFPEKIWSDCSKCPKFHCCDEVALVIVQ
ncbi:MAG: GNAT family N-acetyltransferase [Lentisphaerae bacterium]|nr:GNAT family N-acetyltransferase [Lentisphaerota bacterium]MBR2872313.1 GNAT family N-acetyltransferase [Lentisphaeria bacterium]